MKGYYEFLLFSIVVVIEIHNVELMVIPDVLPSFSGFKVYRVNATTEEQFKVLVELQNEGDLDFWHTPQLNDFTDIMVATEEENEFKAKMNKYNFTYKVIIGDIQSAVSQSSMPRLKNAEMSWTEYHYVEEIYEWMELMCNAYRHVCTLISIGNSTEGRDLKLMKIALPHGTVSKPAVYIDGTFHAREWISPAVATYIAHELVTSSDEHLDLLKIYDFYVMPVVNPDGYSHSCSFNRLWRKTRAYSNTYSDMIGCRGVDLNRNFGFHWGEEGSSSLPCSIIYRGQTSFSEPESKAVRDFVLKSPANWTVYLSLHSYGQKWLTPWGYTKTLPDDYQELKRVADIAVAALKEKYGTEYTVGSSTDILYSSSGGSDDWFKGTVKCRYAYTIELRDTGLFGFLLPKSQIIPTAEETWMGIKALLRAIPDYSENKNDWSGNPSSQPDVHWDYHHSDEHEVHFDDHDHHDEHNEHALEYEHKQHRDQHEYEHHLEIETDHDETKHEDEQHTLEVHSDDHHHEHHETLKHNENNFDHSEHHDDDHRESADHHDEHHLDNIEHHEEHHVDNVEYHEEHHLDNVEHHETVHVEEHHVEEDHHENEESGDKKAKARMYIDWTNEEFIPVDSVFVTEQSKVPDYGIEETNENEHK